MNARKLKKNRLVFFNQKSSTFELRMKKKALKLFEIAEQFMADTFLLKLTQFEKTASIGKTFISLGNLIIKFQFRN